MGRTLTRGRRDQGGGGDVPTTTTIESLFREGSCERYFWEITTRKKFILSFQRRKGTTDIPFLSSLPPAQDSPSRRRELRPSSTRRTSVAVPPSRPTRPCLHPLVRSPVSRDSTVRHWGRGSIYPVGERPSTPVVDLGVRPWSGLKRNH